MLSLLRARRFLPLFVTQALGAVNDNLFKNALVVLALYRLAHVGPILVALAGGVFILPYALFSATAGQLADAREKSALIRITKYWELFLAVLAAAGFLAGNFAVLMVVLFGFGVQATFFSPLKYGILPDHLQGTELVAGNGLIEAGTFVGILAGTVAGGALVILPGGARAVAAAAVLIAMAGIASSYAIPRAPIAEPGLRPDWNVMAQSARLLKLARETATVWFAILAISWFWAIGAILLAEFPTIAHDALRANGRVVTLMLAVFTVGVGVGSLACAKLLHGVASTRAVAFAGVGVTVFTADFALTAMRAPALPDVAAVLAAFAGWHMLADLLAVAVCGGIYSVPLYVILQERAPPRQRSRMIAANNIMNAFAGVIGAGLTAALYAAGLSGARILLLAALANLGVALWVFRVR